jgi:hypothetical protein
MDSLGKSNLYTWGLGIFRTSKRLIERNRLVRLSRSARQRVEDFEADFPGSKNRPTCCALRLLENKKPTVSTGVLAVGSVSFDR